MKLSIIIPVYNVEKYIARCLNSILDQDVDSKDYEVIVINDGSSDNSESILNKYAQTYFNFRVFTQKNKGVGNARNKGIELANGKYIYFLDSDDYLANNVLKDILFYVEKYNLDVLTFKSIKTSVLDLNESNTDNIRDFSLSVRNGMEYLSHCHFEGETCWWYVINKKHLDELGIKFVEGKWLEDVIFTVTLLLDSKRVAHLPIDAHRYVKREGSIMTTQANRKKLIMIDAMKSAVLGYETIINRLIFSKKKVSKKLIHRLKFRQQTFAFFMMARMLKSTMQLSEIKKIMGELAKTRAYPLNSFLDKDYNKFIYKILVKAFNYKQLFFLIFRSINPFFRMKNYILK